MRNENSKEVLTNRSESGRKPFCVAPLSLPLSRRAVSRSWLDSPTRGLSRRRSEKALRWATMARTRSPICHLPATLFRRPRLTSSSGNQRFPPENRNILPQEGVSKVGLKGHFAVSPLNCRPKEDGDRRRRSEASHPRTALGGRGARRVVGKCCRVLAVSLALRMVRGR